MPNTLPLGNSRLNANYVGGPTTLSHGRITIGGDLANDPPTIVLNKAAFAVPAPYTFGNAFILPSTRQAAFGSENLSFFKRETFRDHYVFELRFDMINAFNRKDPSNLDTNLTSPGFGTYSSSAVPPRNGQVGAKLSF